MLQNCLKKICPHQIGPLILRLLIGYLEESQETSDYWQGVEFCILVQKNNHVIHILMDLILRFFLGAVKAT